MKSLIHWLCFYTHTKHRLHVTPFLQKLYSWRKPIKPYAFIRVHNEIKTIDTCFESIIDCVAGGVIGFNSCTDGTKEYILAFCQKYPQFTPVEYPYDVIPGGDFRYKEEQLDDNLCLDSYYNFVWEKLPKNEWIIKIDADHIYNKKYLQDLCKLPIRKKDCVILNRINLHCVDGKVYIHKKHPFSENGDHWIIYNQNIHFQLFRGWINDRFTAYEFLELPKKERKKIYGVLCNWHFPNVKNQRNHFNPDEWILLSEFDVSDYAQQKNMAGRIPDDMIDSTTILAGFADFNHTGKQILPKESK